MKNNISPTLGFRRLLRKVVVASEASVFARFFVRRKGPGKRALILVDAGDFEYHFPVMIEIKKVTGRKDLKRFILFPWRVYRDHPAWVPPLIMEREEFLDRKKNLFFGYGSADYFLAEKNGEVVGRIAAIKNDRHLEIHQDGVGFFGLFESIDDPEVAGALLETARAWLAERGIEKIRGPVDLTMNDGCGVLTHGFDEPPMLLMPYSPPYYAPLLERCGFEKIEDLYSYRIGRPDGDRIPERLERALQLAHKRSGATIRPANIKKFDEEMERVYEIYRKAWVNNWADVPFTREELMKTGRDMKMFADPDLIFFAEIDGETVGICITLPNMNQALRRANGRLLPFGWWKIMRDKSKINQIRVIVMGVLHEYRRKGLEAAMVYYIYKNAMEKGYQWAEMGWILESNTVMNRLVERIDGDRFKSYRLFQRDV